MLVDGKGTDEDSDTGDRGSWRPVRSVTYSQAALQDLFQVDCVQVENQHSVNDEEVERNIASP